MFYLPWNFQKSRVINCKLNNDNNSLILIREWVIKKKAVAIYINAFVV